MVSASRGKCFEESTGWDERVRDVESQDLSREGGERTSYEDRRYRDGGRRKRVLVFREDDPKEIVP